MVVALGSMWLAVAGYLPWPLAAPIVAVGGYITVGRVHGRPLHAMLPALARFWWRRLRGRHRWFRAVPLISDDGIPVDVPPGLAGLDLYEADVTWVAAGRRDPIGVVHDRAAGTVSATIRPNGDGQFALLDDHEQLSRADGWGGALAGFARERSHVVRVKWDDWAAPVPLQDQIGELERRWADEATTPARDSYLELMHAVAPDVVRHEVLVTVTVAVARPPPRHRPQRRRVVDGDHHPVRRAAPVPGPPRRRTDPGAGRVVGRRSDRRQPGPLGPVGR